MLSIAFAALVVASSPIDEKRHEQIVDLQKIIKLSGRQPELLFRLADLWLEESRARSDDPAAREKAIALFAELSQQHADFARADEVLFLLGKTLLDANDDRRATAAFKRLVTRHPQSRFVAESHFALGEQLFAKSNGRRDWLKRALAEYETAATPDAIYKQGWCQLNLGDFAAAQAKFREVIALGGARATDAEKDFVRAFEKGGGKPGEFPVVSKDAKRQRALKVMLADLYSDDGFDGEAALTWQALINEDPKVSEALTYQRRIIESVLRMGRKQLVIAQVQKLVKMASELDGDVSEAEPMLAKLATSWHVECRKTREDGCLTSTGAIYDAYLALFPRESRAYDLRFFHAELLFDSSDFTRAAAEYRLVVDRDVECATSGHCAAGRFMEAAALGEINAREALIAASMPHQGAIDPDAALLVAAL
jgi:cellulose synthase operon protein C